VDVVPGQEFVHRPGALRVPRRVDAQVGEGLPPDFGLEAFAPAVEAAAAAPGFFQGDGDAAVPTRQNAFQQAAFDVLLLDVDRLEPALLAEILAGPLQVFTRLHAVPLIGRVRLWDEIGDRGRHIDVAALHFPADAGNRLGHLDDAVEIDLAFAG